MKIHVRTQIHQALDVCLGVLIFTFVLILTRENPLPVDREERWMLLTAYFYLLMAPICLIITIFHQCRPMKTVQVCFALIGFPGLGLAIRFGFAFCAVLGCFLFIGSILRSGLLLIFFWPIASVLIACSGCCFGERKKQKIA